MLIMGACKVAEQQYYGYMNTTSNCNSNEKKLRNLAEDYVKYFDEDENQSVYLLTDPSMNKREKLYQRVKEVVKNNK